MARILVVEDEAIVAMGIKHKLETMGHEVVDTVSTGKDAIRASKIHEPDLSSWTLSSRVKWTV